MNMGPKKDICGLWKAAADRQGLPFGLTEHLGASYSWWKVNKWCDTYGPYAGVPYDGNDPQYKDFYFDNYEHVDEDRTDTQPTPWYTTNKKFQDYWLEVIKELIDLYKPDLLYSDGALPFGTYHVSTDDDENFINGLKAVAYLYNTSIETHGENRAVYNQKDRRPEIYRIGVLDVERSQLPGINTGPWQTDTCIGNWFYDARQEFKKPAHIIEMLVDIISKNGTMLLNVLQRPDGTIDDETVYILDELASWFKVCQEAVYGTRPWRTFGEGESRVLISGFREERLKWNSSDFRFTSKGKTLYAFIMKAPENRVAVIKSLSEQEKVASVRLLGGDKLPFTQSFGTLTVKLPHKLPTAYTNCIALELE